MDAWASDALMWNSIVYSFQIGKLFLFPLLILLEKCIAVTFHHAHNHDERKQNDKIDYSCKKDTNDVFPSQPMYNHDLKYLTLTTVNIDCNGQ